MSSGEESGSCGRQEHNRQLFVHFDGDGATVDPDWALGAIESGEVDEEVPDVDPA